MEDNKNIFLDISRVEPKIGLSEAILLRIGQEKKRLAKIRLIYTSAIEVVSLFALIPAIQYFVEEFSQSGFYQYLSLLFSDGGTILTYWRELGLSLLESMPAMSITAIFVLVFISIATSKFIIQDSKIIFNRAQLA